MARIELKDLEHTEGEQEQQTAKGIFGGQTGNPLLFPGLVYSTTSDDLLAPSDKPDWSTGGTFDDTDIVH